ncbi:MAG: sulfite exporter TauE/SafE family protein [Gemmatimonadaceae bacterium]|nr:sulfite exporter TauE/SafE family protein [Gemmatimonadaceae bacterium]
MLQESARLVGDLSAHPVAAMAAVFAGGVLTSLTPCLYPMIPITISIVGGTASSSRYLHRLGLAATYVVGLAAAYATLGLVAGLTGTLFGSISTSPWLLFAMANGMLLAAAMMADVIPVPIPATLSARAATIGTGGRYAGVFAMGVVSGLVAAPCGAPVMAAILTWVASTKSAILGFLYLFVFSLGMSALLLLMALLAGTSLRLPRPGPWMLWVKRAMAIVLVGVAEYYLMSMGQVLL